MLHTWPPQQGNADTYTLAPCPPPLPRYQPLDTALRRPEHLPFLLEYVAFAHSPAIQAQAVTLVQQLCDRIPDLMLVLLQQPRGTHTLALLRNGFASALQAGLQAQQAAAQGMEEAGDGGCSGLAACAAALCWMLCCVRDAPVAEQMCLWP